MKYKQDEPDTRMKNRTDIVDILKGVDLIYVYPHHRIELSDDGELCQTRSGPNWEGGILTMATCKHLLRTYKTLEPKRVALCGITNKLKGENYLLYIGVIDNMFSSNYELGVYLNQHRRETYLKKLATHNRLGDLFEPLEPLEYPYDSFYFKDPCEDHCRFEEKEKDGQPKFYKDIEYETWTGVKPNCLILNPATVHSEPIFVFTGKLGRSGMAIKGSDAPEQLMSLLDETL